jgi:hypothetical protein
MKRESIKVGAKSKTKRPQATLAYNRPESVEDCLAICKGNESAVASLFNRGYTIWLQDRFGRPMFEEGTANAEIQEAFDAAIPGTTKGHSQAKAPPTVAIPAGKTMSASELQKLLEAQGIKVVLGS